MSYEGLLTPFEEDFGTVLTPRKSHNGCERETIEELMQVALMWDVYDLLACNGNLLMNLSACFCRSRS
jgi:hypothetical protein